MAEAVDLIDIPEALRPVIYGIVGNEHQISDVQQELDALIGQRDDAVAAAAKPFDGSIKDKRRELDALVAHDTATDVKRAILDYINDLNPVDRAAFGLMLEADQTLDEFTSDLVRLAKEGLDHQTHAHMMLGNFSVWQAFTTDLATGDQPTPVGLLSLDWFEELDVQAQFEGRDSSTGVFHKIVRGHFGLSTSESLEVITKPQDPDSVFDVQIPNAVQLAIGGFRYMCEKYDFGYVAGVEVHDMRDNEKLSLIGRNAERINWMASRDGDFEVERGRPRFVGGSSPVEFAVPKVVLLHGDGLRQGLERLMNDDQVDRTIKPALIEELGRIA